MYGGDIDHEINKTFIFKMCVGLSPVAEIIVTASIDRGRLARPLIAIKDAFVLVQPYFLHPEYDGGKQSTLLD